jgi:uncharacterized protein (TIGR03000 family)
MRRRQSIVVLAIVSAFVGMLPLKRAQAQLFGRSQGSGSSSGNGSYYGSTIGGYTQSYPGYYSSGTSSQPTSGGLFRSNTSSYSNTSSGGKGLFGGNGLFGRGPNGNKTRPSDNSAVRTNPYPNSNYAPAAPAAAAAVPTSVPVDDPAIGSIPFVTTAEPPLADPKEPPARPALDASTASRPSSDASTTARPTADASPTTRPGPDPGTVLIIEVRLPSENVLVFVNNEPTRQGGAKRTFVSPHLPAGGEYQYDIRAEWIVNGRKVTQNKLVKGQAGERAVADFSQ